MAPTRRVIFLTPHAVGDAMNAIAARHVEMARTLSAEHEVALAASEVRGAPPEGVPVIPLGVDGQLDGFVGEGDVLVAQGDFFRRYPSLRVPEAPLVVDLVAPTLLEDLETRRLGTDVAGRGDALAHREQMRTLDHLVRRGDLFLAGSERQRDFVLGMLLAAGRLNPRTYRDDPTFDRLVVVVPQGLPDEPPRAAGTGLRSRVRGIGPRDLLLYWGGGIWPWTDPEVIVDAMRAVGESRPGVKLLVAGAGRRGGGTGEGAAAALVARAEEAGLLGRTVFLHEWIPYAERGAALLDADVGVSAHRDVLEARFAVRTRILDYLWAGLPVITTDGDEAARLVRERGLGEVVAPGDAGGWAHAILRLAGSSRRRRDAAGRARETAEGLRWSRVVAPLAAFCRQPRIAPDRQAAGRPGERRGALRRYARKAIGKAARGEFSDLLRGVRWQLLQRGSP